MRSDLKKVFDSQTESGRFIKTSDSPINGLTSEQKVILNRKGNVLFNQGDLVAARRIFLTTGYSDGLNRLAESSEQKGEILDALKLYWLAHNRRMADPIIEKLSAVISKTLVNED